MSQVLRVSLSFLTFRGPSEVSCIESQCSQLHVTAHGSNRVDSFVSKFGVCRRTTHLKLPLPPELVHTTSGLPPLVPFIP